MPIAHTLFVRLLLPSVGEDVPQKGAKTFSAKQCSSGVLCRRTHFYGGRVIGENNNKGKVNNPGS